MSCFNEKKYLKERERHYTHLRAIEISKVPLSPAGSWRHHHHLVCRGLAGVGIAFRVWIVVDILGVVIDVVSIVVFVGIAGYQVDDVEHRYEKSNNTEGADIHIG